MKVLSEKIMRYVLIFSSIVLVFTLASTVIMRYVLKIDIFGLEELIIIPGFWLYFLGAGYATKEKNFHIQADLISSYVESPLINKLIELITSIITFVTSLIMTLWSYTFFKDSVTSGAKTPALKIPLFVSHSSVFIGFLIMTIYFLIHLLGNLLFKNHQESGGDDISWQ